MTTFETLVIVLMILNMALTLLLHVVKQIDLERKEDNRSFSRGGYPKR